MDITCQKGSSGSPVVVRHQKVSIDNASGRIINEERCFLLGIECSCYQTKIAAKLKIGSLEQNMTLNLDYPADLAIVVPAWDLHEINRLIQERSSGNGS